MSNFYTYKELEALTVSLLKTKQKLKDLEQKIDNLPHPAKFGNSLLKIKDKFEVVKLKNNIGDHSLTYDGLKTLFDKYNKTLQTINESISKIEQKLPTYDQWFEFNSVKFLTTAFKNNTANYFLHTDGEFSFHFWQNPSLITNYKKPEDYVFTQLFGINQNPIITDWSPYIEYDFNANTGEVDFKLASFRSTTKGWIQKTWLVIKTEENDTTFDFKKNPLIFKFKDKNYDVQNLLDKIHDRPSHKEIEFSKEVLVLKRTITDENGKTKLNPRIVESGNTVEIHELNDIVRNTKWVGNTLRFQFVYCGGRESSLHGIIKRKGKDFNTKYSLYALICYADKLPNLNESTWTKVFKMDHYVSWIIGNRGERFPEHLEDCSEGAPTVELKLEEIGYYLKFNWTGFLRWEQGVTVNFSMKSLWDTFKIVADVYK